MFKLIFSCLLFVQVLQNAFGQTCSDCISFQNCPAAEMMVTKNDDFAKRVLRDDFCGYENTLPRVCCSKVTSKYNSNLDQHPNLRLLPTDCGGINGERIFGGTEVKLHEFPWMVLISFRTRDGLSFGCGGTLINERYVLTAAHCIDKKDIAGVRIGEHAISTDNYCQTIEGTIKCEERLQNIRVEQAIPHELYKGKPDITNDIGLLRLNKPVIIRTNAKPICLPITADVRSRNVENLNATVAGWGYTETGKSSNLLLATTIPIHTKSGCKGYYNKGRPAYEDNTKFKLCAGENEKDSCGGDSGGPLMLRGIHNGVERYIQQGIVSYGPFRCGSDYPGVYTDVTAYMGWILDHIKP